MSYLISPERSKFILWLLIITIAVVIADSLDCNGEGLQQSLMVDVITCTIGLWVLASSFWECVWAKRTVIVMMLVGILLLTAHLSSMAGLIPPVSEGIMRFFIIFMAAILISLMVRSFISRLRDIKAVMKTGTAWGLVCTIVDFMYFIFFIISIALWQTGAYVIASIIISGMLMALIIRVMTDALFVIWRKQERIIVESMKVTSVTSALDGSRIEDIYKDLYERIVDYFELEKPYLNSELTINDLVKNLYSNKLYISRAISQFTGRNFCQFVNYYRVMHSVESFRKNPELKVHELATSCGFNTIVSYNMAFRLFMGENPSEWCRKEKSHLIKRKKCLVESRK